MIKSTLEKNKEESLKKRKIRHIIKDDLGLRYKRVKKLPL